MARRIILNRRLKRDTPRVSVPTSPRGLLDHIDLLTNPPYWSILLLGHSGVSRNVGKCGEKMHLIIAKYSDDAERKRIEYVLDKWRGRLRITKPDGIISILDGEGVGELVEELYSRTSKGNIRVYRVDEETVEIDKGEREIKLVLNEKKETVEKLVGYVMAKQKAVLKRETKEPLEKVYELTTKKGKGEISVAFREEGKTISLRILINGYGEVVDFLSAKLTDELKYLGGTWNG
jgi:hypothetical protein